MTLPAPPQPAAKRRRKGDPRAAAFVAACYPALDKPHGPATWYVRMDHPDRRGQLHFPFAGIGGER
jgi:hypothetical protein